MTMTIDTYHNMANMLADAVASGKTELTVYETHYKGLGEISYYPDPNKVETKTVCVWRITLKPEGA